MAITQAARVAINELARAHPGQAGEDGSERGEGQGPREERPGVAAVQEDLDARRLTATHSTCAPDASSASMPATARSPRIRRP